MLVDCDIHQAMKSSKDLLPYLPERWRRYITESGWKGPPISNYPKGVNRGVREDAWPEDGPTGSDLGLMQEQLLDRFQIDYGILTGDYWYVSLMHNPDFAAAIAAAYNDHTAEHWLAKDRRLKGSITITAQDPDLAVKEIERWAGHPDFVQVIVAAGSHAPYGNRRYHKIWAACAEAGLPVGIHFGGTGSGDGHAPTPCGWPTYYIEWHTNMVQAMMTHLVSFVCEGVFVKYPKLRVAMIEGGCAWVPSIMWRLDKNWKGLRNEVPWLDRLPSDYIREHVRSTTQPIEEPDNQSHILQTIDMIGSDKFLMFASDYPHWDFDSPSRALPSQLRRDLREQILGLNACEFYSLPVGVKSNGND